jgi:hypothetical protein
MISGILRRVAVGAFLLGAALASAATVPAPAGDEVATARLAAFLAGLAPPPQGPIPFREKRMSALLTEPLEVRGELTLGPDGTLDKHVTEPADERVVIKAGSLTLVRGGKTRVLDLGGDRRWRAFHAGITGLMNRDVQALTRVFSVALEETPGGWTLRLRPRATTGKNGVSQIVAFGQGKQLQGLRIEQGADEWQEMTFATEPSDTHASASR